MSVLSLYLMSTTIAGMTMEEFVDTINGRCQEPHLKLKKRRDLHHAVQISRGWFSREQSRRHVNQMLYYRMFR